MADPLGKGLGDACWAVLGGGGLKGLAHVGAWRALDEAGLRPRGILGTSIGALVGACLAGGMSWERLTELAGELDRSRIIRISRRAVWINGIKSVSVFRGEVLREYVESVLPVKDWEALEMPFQLNAVNLRTGRSEWFGQGARTDVPLVDAVYASTALPVMYPPARLAGEWFVDGGVGDVLPLARAVEVGASGVVGVDVGAGPEDDADLIVEQGMIAVHQRIFSILSGRRRREAAESFTALPFLFIRPELDGFSTFDFQRVPYFLEEGYRATRWAIETGALRGAGETG